MSIRAEKTAGRRMGTWEGNGSWTLSKPSESGGYGLNYDSYTGFVMI
jgi:hypothetical protein